jgi:hypothetical protein
MWNEIDRGKPKYSGKTCPSAALSTTNPTWIGPGSNPGLRGERPATNLLNHGTASTALTTHLLLRYKINHTAITGQARIRLTVTLAIRSDIYFWSQQWKYLSENLPRLLIFRYQHVIRKYIISFS